MSRKPCCSGEGLKKGAWTIEEDKKLITYIQEHGEGGWRDIPGKAGLKRCGKSCRLRWTNYLKPDIKRGEFSAEEEQIIMMLHASRGNKWSIIARHLPKRTDNEIKNYWNTHLKRRLMEQGIDPATHKPLITSNPTPATPSTSLSPENSNSDYFQDAPNPVDEQSPPPLSSSSGKKTSSSSISNLLNRMATRVTSINKGILSASMEGGSISSTAASSPNAWDINNTNNNTAQDHESHVSMATNDTDPFFSQSSWYPDQEVDFSEFLEEFGQDRDGFYEHDRLMSDLVSSSTSFEEDTIMSRMEGWSDYLLEQPNYDFMGIQFSPPGGDGED